jgi:NSS family neurotransmitter:Na+ symporter
MHREAADATSSAAGRPGGDIWSSPLGFLLATSAAAIGLGSLWRFPYVAGANGGGAFVIVYIAVIAAICVPLMIAEMAMGRRGHGSVVSSMARLVRAENVSPAWRVIGWLSLIVPFFGLSYYSVVAGWGVDYAREAIFSGFAGTTGESSRALFSTLIGSPWRQGLFQFAFIMGVAIIVGAGVQRGIEFVSRIKMTALFVILIGIVLYNAATVGIGSSVRFLLYPDFSAMTGASLLTATGQALFSTAIGAGVLMTYAAYLPKGVSIPQSAGMVSLAVVFISLMAGLAIFPIVFSSGLAPSEGPNLIFVSLPVAFGSMPGGRIISIAFFSLIALGAFTTAVGMLEPVVAWLIEATGLRRGWLALMAATAVWLVGLPSLLSFSVLKDVHPLGAIKGFADKTFFDMLDLGIAELLLPANALLIAG